ncbi:MAG: SoxY-related AACIE arm protein [Hyphomicrobiaceae bacterium]
MDRTPSRRELVRRVAALSLAPAVVTLVPASARATPEEMQAAILRVTGGVEPKPGRVKIEIPPLSENGNTVPITVTVESPMTAKDHVKAIHIFNERNPQPNIISAWLGPRAGQATLQTRARLSDTQNIVAIAQLSDGSFWSQSAHVIVTLGACLEEPI